MQLFSSAMRHNRLLPTFSAPSRVRYLRFKQGSESLCAVPGLSHRGSNRNLSHSTHILSPVADGNRPASPDGAKPNPERGASAANGSLLDRAMTFAPWGKNYDFTGAWAGEDGSGQFAHCGPELNTPWRIGRTLNDPQSVREVSGHTGRT